MNIEANQEQFLEELLSLKQDLIDALSSENVEKYREDYKGRYSPERFKEFFVEKAALHNIFKYVLIRMIEETMARVKVKLNKEGLNNWHEMSKNFRKDYILLFQFAETDVKREKDLEEIFIDTVYDESHLVTRTENVMLKYIPELAKYEFNSLSASSTLTLIDTLYGVEKREELQNFHQGSSITNFLLQQVGLL
ncbi:hypothetical protein [Virgibacillus salexigens]|uniref:Uncharacterized protein n=1 Tax=Virgibacillus kapii TaxID=1638645 RepID=A0ABQ2DHA7_9BACI|nr:hypothetical protein [Virgibacillus kapii]GGJ55451.1 hypothetical protein GCM10007111_17150 [Virgibacillus kapii]